ncbi:MAG: hypothetical protein VX727_10145 [Planctomycetota bacterium]|nr:hypothetical protein [Planctomycetota bacterium]
MRSSLHSILILGCVAPLLIACEESEPPAPIEPAPTATSAPTSNSLLDSLEITQTIDTSASTTEPDDPTSAVFLGLETTKPITWLWQPPKRSMRKANYLVPGTNGSEPAELTVTHFPEAPGNTPEANIRRWTSQFRSVDGGPAKAKVETFTVGTMPVTLVEIEGEYMGMGGAWHQADQRMLVSMVQAPVGSVFLKLLGPEGTVDANRQAYMDFVKGLKPTQ